MKCQILFSKKNIINLSSAEFAKRVLKVTIYLNTSDVDHIGRSRNKWLWASADIECLNQLPYSQSDQGLCCSKTGLLVPVECP